MLPAIPSKKPKLSYLILALIFIFAFIVPFYIFKFFYSGFRHSPSSYIDNKSSILFTNPLLIKGAGSFASIKSSDNLNPQEKKDFLFFIWVKNRSITQDQGRNIFLLKYDENLKSKAGYGLALVSKNGRVHPELYWKGEKEGGWHQFPDIPDYKDMWIVYVMSFRDNKSLGLHLVVPSLIGEKPQIKLVGGYPLEIDVKNSGNLIIGAPEHSNFRGSIGTFGILEKTNLTENFNDILKLIANNPVEPPKDLDPGLISLWMSEGRKDVSTGHLVSEEFRVNKR